jgi:hypothetical protein
MDADEQRGQTLKAWRFWLLANGCQQEPLCRDCRWQWEYLQSVGYGRSQGDEK